MNKNKLSYIVLIILLVFGKQLSAQHVYKIWEGQEIPYYKSNSLKEYEAEAYGTTCIYNIIEPTLTVYKAEGSNSGNAVIIIPGGGYGLVAMYHEGYDLAEELSKNGITAAVLKYRLPNPKSSDQPQHVPLSDSRRALSLLRSMSEEYGFDINKVGLLGFSAGSHLATVASLLKSEKTSENPNFSALIYGVTDFSGENMKWLENSLYYRKLSKEELAKNLLLNHVSKDAPPAFLVHAYDDDVCYVKESTLYAEKLHQNGVPVEMHLFPKGGHGFGMGRAEDGTDQWVQLFISWLNSGLPL